VAPPDEEAEEAEEAEKEVYGDWDELTQLAIARRWTWLASPLDDGHSCVLEGIFSAAVADVPARADDAGNGDARVRSRAAQIAAALRQSSYPLDFCARLVPDAVGASAAACDGLVVLAESEASSLLNTSPIVLRVEEQGAQLDEHDAAEPDDEAAEPLGAVEGPGWGSSAVASAAARDAAESLAALQNVTGWRLAAAALARHRHAAQLAPQLAFLVAKHRLSLDGLAKRLGVAGAPELRAWFVASG
jgi:hypothetical protein